MMLTMQRLVGAAEIGEALGGLSRQRVNQLSTKADFPAPIVELRMGKVWDLADIARWAKERGRTMLPLDASD